MWKASSWQTHLNKPLQSVIQRACANIFSTTCAVPTGCQHGRALAAQARCPGFGSLKWTHFSLTCAPHIKDCGGRGRGGGGVVACLLDVAQWSGRIELNCILENTSYTIQASLVWFLVSDGIFTFLYIFPPQNIFVVIDFNSRGSLNCQPCSQASSFKVHVNKATTFSFYFLPLNSITISSWGKLF